MAYQNVKILYGGGLNTKDADFDVQDDQSTDLKNVTFDSPTTVKTRPGYSQFGDTIAGLKPCVGMGKYEYSSGTGSFINSVYGVFGADVRKYVAGTWTAQGLALTDGAQAQLVQANNCLYVWNGTDSVQKLSNATWSVLASGAPVSGAHNIAKYFVWTKRGLGFALSTDVFPDHAYVTGDANGSVGDPEDFTGGWIYPVGLGDGFGKITGGIEFGSAGVVVVKERAIYMLTGATGDDISVDLKVAGIGCAAPKTLCTDGNYVYFQAADGHMYAFDGTSHWKVSDILTRTIEDGIDENYINKSCAVYDSVNERILLTVVPTGETTPSLTLPLYVDRSVIATKEYLNKVWSLWTNIPAACWIEFSSVNGSLPSLFFGTSANSGKVYQMYSGTDDDGVAIDAYYVTKNFDAGSPDREKQWKYLYTNAKSTGVWELNIEYNSNNGGFTGTTPSTLDLTPNGAVLPFTLPVVLDDGFLVQNNMTIVPVSSRYIKLKFSINTINQFFEIFNATLYYRYSKLRLRISQT